jgi:hypothetical protein
MQMKGEKMKKKLKKLHLQIRKWKNDSSNALCWSFYCLIIISQWILIAFNLQDVFFVMLISFNNKCQNTNKEMFNIV